MKQSRPFFDQVRIEDEGRLRTRTGKIARLPYEVREEVCRRLRDGATAQGVADWLNGARGDARPPGVQRVLEEQFGGEAVSDENVRAWKLGGYVEWLARQERTEHVKELAGYAARLSGQAKACTTNGEGSITEGAAAIVSGQLLELLEAADGTMSAEEVGNVVSSLTALRAQEVAQQRVELEREKLKRKDEELALERAKFQRVTCELFLKWQGDERAKGIAEGPASNAEKIEALGQAMFGELWK